MNAIRTLALAAVVAVAGISGTASAQSAAERYENYSGAVVVYERCNGMRFNQSDMLALNNRIVELVGEQISAGTRLTGIQRAKRYWAARYAKEVTEIEVPYNEAITAEQVRAKLAERPDVAGLAVPGMPQGALGMSGDPEPYDVYAVPRDPKAEPYVFLSIGG